MRRSRASPESAPTKPRPRPEPAQSAWDGAIAHVVRGVPGGHFVSLRDGNFERLSGGQMAVGFHGEGNGHGKPGLLRRPRRANRFVHVIHFDLCVVASLCLLRRHDVIWNVAIPAGAEASADDHRRFLGVVLVATLPAISAQA